MSARNRLENKKIRRLEREDHAVRVEEQRRLQARLEYLAYAPPETFGELEAEVNRLIEEEEPGKPCLPVTCSHEKTEIEGIMRATCDYEKEES